MNGRRTRSPGCIPRRRWHPARRQTLPEHQPSPPGPLTAAEGWAGHWDSVRRGRRRDRERAPAETAGAEHDLLYARARGHGHVRDGDGERVDGDDRVPRRADQLRAGQRERRRLAADCTSKRLLAAAAATRKSRLKFGSPSAFHKKEDDVTNRDDSPPIASRD